MNSKLVQSGIAALSMLGASAAFAAEPAVAKAPASRWADIANLPDLWTGTWQGTSPMVDGQINVKYTDKAQAYVARYKPVADISYGAAGCKTPGMPFVMQIAAMPIKFMVEPGMVAIYIESHSQTRFIHMNQPHSNPVDPSYLGESVGRWEDNTLVVDTIGFVDDIALQYGVRELKPGEDGFLKKIVFGPHGPNLHMVERMRLKDPNTLEIKNTIMDSSIWSTPYETTRTWKRRSGSHAKPMEWVCSENINIFDPTTNTHLSEDPEVVLKRLETQQGK
jgi:hypothetical protein